MSAGVRNKSGKPKDVVKHYSRVGMGMPPICGNKRYGYSSTHISEVTCLHCKSKIDKLIN